MRELVLCAAGKVNAVVASMACLSLGCAWFLGVARCSTPSFERDALSELWECIVLTPVLSSVFFLWSLC